jgi:hypothetical protein
MCGDGFRLFGITHWMSEPLSPLTQALCVSYQI